MIPHAYRFHGYGGLRFVYRAGKTVRVDSLALRYTRNDRQQRYRLAVVVGRKVSKSAVVRNRIRRRLYEASRVRLEGFDEPYDLVLTVFSDRLATIEASVIASSIEQLFDKANLLKIKPATNSSL